MFDFWSFKGLLIYIHADGCDCSIWFLVLLLAGKLRSEYGDDRFRDVHSLLHECEPVPLNNELCKHDKLRDNVSIEFGLSQFVIGPE